jgi:hypothetical protein
MPQMPESLHTALIERSPAFHGVESTGLLRGADRLGAFASLACALHCASWPILLVLLPTLGGTFLGSESFERGFVLGATVLALSTLAWGYARHRNASALLLLLPGLALVWFGSFGPFHHQLLPHAALMSVGGLCIAAAHLRNLRLARPHRHDSSCRH